MGLVCRRVEFLTNNQFTKNIKINNYNKYNIYQKLTFELKN